jgi:DNA-binding transcriptional LysR family regulator
MEMRQVRYFLTACETLNFTRAAETCRVSTPSLSRAIRGLEEELGGELFRRERHLTHLTELGRMMRDQLSVALTAVDAARRLASRYGRLEDAPLRIGMERGLSRSPCVAFLTALTAGSPALAAQIAPGDAEVLCERLMGGDVDFALCATPIGGERMRRWPLYAERLAVACPADAPTGSALAALREGPFIGRSDLALDAAFAVAEGARTGDPPQARCVVEGEEWALSLVAAGHGVAIVSEFAKPPAGVALRPLPAPTFWREVGLVIVSGRRHAAPTALALRVARGFAWPAATASSACAAAG